MAITFFGRASTPADNGTNAANAVTITPPGSMVAGMFVWVRVSTRTTSASLTVNNTGGQDWTTLTARSGSSCTSRSFYCTYNGTWSADPSWSSPDGTAGVPVTGVMNVFSPTGAGYTWGVDVAETTAAVSAPGGSFDVTITGITTLTDGAVVIASWLASDDITWSLQTGGGWTNPGGVTQVRNTSGNDTSNSTAYLITVGAGATGNVTNRESADTTAQTSIVAIKEIAPAVAAERAIMYARRRGR